MRKMKDCGIDWIGQVPNDWEITRLRFTAEIVRGGSPRPIESFISDDGEGFNWVKIGDADKDNKYITHTSCKIIRSGLSKTRMVHANDLILTNSMSFGEPYIMGIDGCIHDGWVAFSKYKGIVKEFLYWCLLSDLCRIQFEKQVDGGVVQNLNIDKIGNTIVFLPPLAEQKKIAYFLDEKCGEIDSIRSDIQKQIDILNDYKKSIITEAVTKGLNPKAKLKDSGIEWIGKIPEGWSIKKIKFLLSNETDSLKVGPFGSQLSGTDLVSDGFWVYSQRVVLDRNFENNTMFISKEKFDSMKGFHVRTDDILITTRGSIGKICKVPESFSEGVLHPCVIKFRIDQNKYSYKFLEFIFNDSGIVEKQLNYLSNSTTIEVIYSGTLKNLQVPYPPLSEQKAIADYLDEKCSEIDATIADKQRQLETLDEYKKSLIFEYVTGKKEVS